MRGRLGAVLVCALLVSCDQSNSVSSPPASSEPASSAAAVPDEAALGRQALADCVEADAKVSDDWQAAIASGKSNGDFTQGPFRNHMQAMVLACRAILPAFVVDSPDKQIAAMARICRDGYRFKIAAYQDMLDGAADENAAQGMIKGGELLAKCNAAMNKAAAR